MRARQDIGTALSKAELAAEWRELSQQRRGMSAAERGSWATRSRQEFRRQEAHRLRAVVGDGGDGNAEEIDGQRREAYLWGLGSFDFPLALENFENIILEATGGTHAQDLPGARHFCRVLRKELRENIFVADDGDDGCPRPSCFLIQGDCVLPTRRAAFHVLPPNDAEGSVAGFVLRPRDLIRSLRFLHPVLRDSVTPGFRALSPRR